MYGKRESSVREAGGSDPPVPPHLKRTRWLTLTSSLPPPLPRAKWSALVVRSSAIVRAYKFYNLL